MIRVALRMLEGRKGVKLYAFLNSELFGGEKIASRYHRFTPGIRVYGYSWIWTRLASESILNGVH